MLKQSGFAYILVINDTFAGESYEDLHLHVSQVFENLTFEIENFYEYLEVNFHTLIWQDYI